jgi:hypothetical protein
MNHPTEGSIAHQIVAWIAFIAVVVFVCAAYFVL